MSEMNEKHYTPKKAAERIGVSDSLIKKAIKDGKLEAMQIPGSGPVGYSYMISETNLFAWAENRRKRKTIVKGVSEMTIDDLAEELLKRMKHEYERGYHDGMKKAKEEYLAALKSVKL